MGFIFLHFVYAFVYNRHMENMQIAGFHWDEDNRVKCQKHGVSITEIEFVLSRDFAISPDEAHSETECRFQAIGKTEGEKYLFIIFTLRQQEGDTLIRPISARYMHKKEVDAYEEENSDV
jgi:hypothetical protein